MASEEAAFWMQAKIAAANLALEILVEKDGRMSLRHQKAAGDPERPSDDKVATFRAFLARNRAMILKANCIDPCDPVAEDARRFKAWLESLKDEGLALTTVGGEVILFAEERRRLLRTYQEDPKWILSAHRFQKAMRAVVSLRETGGAVPELWAAEWGQELTGEKSPHEPPKKWVAEWGTKGQPVKPKVTEETLFDG